MIKTKFTFIIYFMLFLALPFGALFLFFLIMPFLSKDPNAFFAVLIPLLFMSFGLVVLRYYYKYKSHVVELRDDVISLKLFYGFGKEILFPYKELELIPSWTHARFGYGSKLLVYHKGKRISELSEFSYSNYTSILSIIGNRKALSPYMEDGYWAVFSKNKKGVIK